jgi:hypothetical protein
MKGGFITFEKEVKQVESVIALGNSFYWIFEYLKKIIHIGTRLMPEQLLKNRIVLNVNNL